MRQSAAYFSLIWITYMPQFLNLVEPTKSFFRNSPEITLFSFSAHTIYVIILLCCISAIILMRSMHDSLARREKYLPLQCFLGIGAFAILFLLIFTDGAITVTFSFGLIPTILSATIGFIGAYIIRCFYLRDCQSSEKYHRIATVTKLLNEPF